MRILYLTPGCFDKGGISRYCRYQIRALRELVGPDRVRVLSLLGPDASSFEEPFEVAFAAGGNSRSDKVQFVSQAVRHALLFRPTVVWTAHVNFAGFAVALARATGAKTVLNAYGSEVWSGLRVDAEWGMKASGHVMADCHFTARYLEAQGLRAPNSVRVIWDCVDLKRFRAEPPRADVLSHYGIPTQPGALNVLTLGRMTPQTDYKGYLRLFEVFLRLHRDYPTAHLIYAGRGALGETIRSKALAAGVADRVHVLGGVDEAHLRDVYAGAYVFSLVTDRGPGRGEGIPLTPLEAAACRVPILVGNQDGSQEAAEDGVSGYVLDPFDLDANETALRRLLGSRDLREQMAEAARKRIVEQFDFNRFKSQHGACLNDWGLD